MGIITLIEAQDPIASLAAIRALAHVREYLNLSLAGLSALVSDPRSHIAHPVSRKTVNDWEHGLYSIHPGCVRQIERIIEDAIHHEIAYDKMLDESPRRFHIRITIGRRWYVRAYTRCVKCQRPYHITRLVSRRCARCITRSKHHAI